MENKEKIEKLGRSDTYELMRKVTKVQAKYLILLNQSYPKLNL